MQIYSAVTRRHLERGDAPDSALPLAKAHGEAFLRHFGFNESPFGVTPDPQFLFSTPMHRAALQALINSIESKLGFSVLLGDPGTGKTTLLFQLLTRYGDCARTAFVFQTQCSPRDLLRYIASELELPGLIRDEVSLHQRLKGMLVKEARAGRKVLIIIDEAQNLQPASLEAIRLLSDFESPAAKLLHILLAGSSRLGETLLAPELSAFAQRIATVCRLEPLSEDEVNAYVAFRLGVAAPGVTEGIFSAEALAEIACLSGGVPRLVNSICYRALMLAYQDDRQCVSRELVEQAARDLDLAKSRGRDTTAGKTVSEQRESAFSSSVGFTRLSEKYASGSKCIDGARPPLQGQAQGSADLLQTFSNSLSERVPDSGGPSRSTNFEPRSSSAKADHAGRPKPPARIKSNDAWPQNRFLLLFAGVAILLAGLWMGSHLLQTKAPAAGRSANLSQPKAIASDAKDGDTSSSLQEPDALGIPQANAARVQPPSAQSATAQTNPETKDRPVNGMARTGPASVVVDTLPKNPVPSRFSRESSNASYATAPSNVEAISTNSQTLKLPVASGPSSVPRLEAPAPADPSKVAPTALHPVKVVQPQYPQKARMWHIEGDVLLELTIDADGTVNRVRPISGNGILIQAAEEAVRQWHYSPSTVDQLPVPGVTQVRFTFRLNP